MLEWLRRYLRPFPPPPDRPPIPHYETKALNKAPPVKIPTFIFLGRGKWVRTDYYGGGFCGVVSVIQSMHASLSQFSGHCPRGSVLRLRDEPIPDDPVSSG